MENFKHYAQRIKTARNLADRLERAWMRYGRQKEFQGKRDFFRQYQNERNAESRTMLLDLLVPDRMCPICKRILLDPKNWTVAMIHPNRDEVVLRSGKTRFKRIPVQLRCRMCKDVKLEVKYDTDGIVTIDGARAIVDGYKLREFRYVKNASTRLFAHLCLLNSTGYLRSIEKIGRHTVLLHTGLKIKKAISMLCVTNEEIDRLQREALEKWEAGPPIRKDME